MNKVFTIAAGTAIGIGAYVVLTAYDGPTYHDEVSRIIQGNCQTCHRAGGVGPFKFETYSQVYRRRGMIQHVIEDRIMPPWFAAPEIGHFANDRSLPDIDRETMLAWLDAGAPEGDIDLTPEPLEWTPGWQLGEPDAELALPEPVHVPAEGTVEYQYTYVPTDFGEDMWIEAMEIRPTDFSTVHHVLVFVEEPNAEDQRGGIDGYMGIWVPGFQGSVFPENSAKLLPAGATLKFQVHYTPNGEEAIDQTSIGFHFTDGAPERVVETMSAFNTRFEIPAHDPNYTMMAEHEFSGAGEILSLLPHMHLRGKAFRYDLTYPDGREVQLLDVPRYDFNWQLEYEFEEPIQVVAGTTLRATAWYDNSAANEFNPDPTATIFFGEQTEEEMMMGYFDWIPASGGMAAAGGG
jgi:hypothetical protein